MPTGARAQSDELKRLLQELKAERQMRLETEKALRQVQERYRQLFNHAPAGIYDADFRNINERKLAEQALKASEEKYRTIIENIQEGYFEVDLAGNMTFFNEPVCRILGYSRKELMGMNNRRYTTADSARKMYQTFNEVYRNGLPSTITDYELVRKDGGTLVMELSTYLMTDSGTGRPIGFRGFVRDISDRLKAEEEKRKLERKLQVVQKLESIATLAGGVAHDFNNLMMSILGNISLMQIDRGGGRAPAEASGDC
jgi:two-component system cell cycle sensor histidine kinase/response regulator CckA